MALNSSNKCLTRRNDTLSREISLSKVSMLLFKKSGLLNKERCYHLGSKFFTFKVEPFQKRFIVQESKYDNQ